MFLFLFFNSCSDHVSALLTNFPQLFMAYQIKSNSSAWHSWPAINLQPVPNLFLQPQIITSSQQKAEPNQITHHFPILCFHYPTPILHIMERRRNASFILGREWEASGIPEHTFESLHRSRLKKETDFGLEYAQFFSKRQLCFLSFCFFLFFSPPLLFLNSFCRLVMKLEKYHLETYLLDTYPTCSHYLPS